MKQMVNYILIIALILSQITIPVFASTSRDINVYAIANRSEVSEGDTLEVTLKIKDLVADGSNTSVGFQFRFDYDNTVLEYTGRSFGSVLRQLSTKQVNTKTSGQVGIMGVISNNVEITDGELVTLSFYVKSSTAGTIGFQLLNSTGSIPLTFGTLPEVVVAGEALPVLSVSASKKTIHMGDTITYSFDLSPVEDFEAIQFDFQYDTTKLEYVTSIRGEIFDEAISGGINPVEDVVKVVVVYGNTTSFAGNICEITFRTKADAFYGLVSSQVLNLKSPIDFEVDNADGMVEIVQNAEEIVAVNAVIAQITAIGEVTVDSGEAIKAAEEAYAALSEAQKTFVTNHSTLEAARATYNELVYGAGAIQKGVDSNGIKWYLYGNGLIRFVGASAMENFSQEAPWDNFKDTIKEIVIEENITHIGDKSFYLCTAATTVTIPNTVTSIGDMAFYGCDRITIYGERGTYAETYARENGFSFVDTTPTELKEIIVETYSDNTKHFFDVRLDEDAEDATVYLVSYDNHNKVIEIDLLALNSNDATTLSLTKNSNAKFAKLFIWDANALYPIAKMKVLDL